MRRHFIVKVILALALIGLLNAGIRGAFRAGWWEGYQADQVAETEEGATPYTWPRAMPFGSGPFGPRAYYGYRPFGLLRGLFTFVLLLFLFGLLAKALGFWAWRQAWKATGKDWRKMWTHGHAHGHPRHHGHAADGRPMHAPRGRRPPHWPHGPMPPWCWGDEEEAEGEAGEVESPDEEQVVKVKPDAEQVEDES
jgi:hypothetical protein